MTGGRPRSVDRGWAEAGGYFRKLGVCETQERTDSSPKAGSGSQGGEGMSTMVGPKSVEGENSAGSAGSLRAFDPADVDVELSKK
jgi:hypothetical protein